MALTQHAWFRALIYVGIFFLSWAIDIGSFIALYEKVFYPSLGTLIYTIFSPALYALLFSIYFLKRKHYFSLIVPLLNFFIGLILFALAMLFMIGSSSA
ncbi:hypothetical protein [Sulfurisphaera ohwakuensis]|uniref:Cellulose synthase/poly-beta-1,6-N-acetylglucosamine synthase-like glycosyltransferase n=1 Tax=Sulfurisphaera ohwakuensis TaxID=69656 RepID=A0A650CK27_SULOH|nr:hypothetical protein [Sulfurisphaera ohwakuensis]MBB5255158.1 cellulose synthase/poly-beta-1,6-N-acetylglucosamine synthase-like glycosyltransferase [Sulfurisphaera ohwakuensis]QGR18221.1 hypothetical protein D1869_14255 [Sulfurisphaera ohwakuensis]